MSTSDESTAFLDDEHSNQDRLIGSSLPQTHWSKKQTAGINRISSLFSHLLVFVFTLAVWFLVWTNHSHHGRNKPPKISTGHLLELQAPDLVDAYGSFASDARLLTCGFSVAEAQARGCEYDILSGRYLPPFCIDREAIEQYQSDGSWFGYADSNCTELLSVEQMASRDVYYTSIRDHIVHCASLWRKLYLTVFENRQYVDSLIASKEHTFHCAQFIVDMTDLKIDHWTSPIPVYVGQAGCFVKD